MIDNTTDELMSDEEEVSLTDVDDLFDEELDSYVPGDVTSDKGIPLLNDAIPLDEEQFDGQESFDGPKIKPNKKKSSKKH